MFCDYWVVGWEEFTLWHPFVICIIVRLCPLVELYVVTFCYFVFVFYD